MPPKAIGPLISNLPLTMSPAFRLGTKLYSLPQFGQKPFSSFTGFSQLWQRRLFTGTTGFAITWDSGSCVGSSGRFTRPAPKARRRLAMAERLVWRRLVRPEALMPVVEPVIAVPCVATVPVFTVPVMLTVPTRWEIVPPAIAACIGCGVAAAAGFVASRLLPAGARPHSSHTPSTILPSQPVRSHFCAILRSLKRPSRGFDDSAVFLGDSVWLALWASPRTPSTFKLYFSSLFSRARSE